MYNYEGTNHTLSDLASKYRMAVDPIPILRFEAAAAQIARAADIVGLVEPEKQREFLWRVYNETTCSYCFRVAGWEGGRDWSTGELDADFYCGAHTKLAPAGVVALEIKPTPF